MYNIYVYIYIGLTPTLTSTPTLTLNPLTPNSNPIAHIDIREGDNPKAGWGGGVTRSLTRSGLGSRLRVHFNHFTQCAFVLTSVKTSGLPRVNLDCFKSELKACHGRR